MKIKFIIGILLFMLAAGCKPTEKGYKQAYDAAKAKREYVDPDAELLTGGHKLLDENSTNWIALGRDTLQIQHFYLKPEDGKPWPQAGPYRLAVAMFKMNTNSSSMLNDLKNGDLKPRVATDGKDRHFIIAGSATTADSLKYVLDAFKKENPGFRYIGLTHEQPLIIVSR